MKAHNKFFAGLRELYFPVLAVLAALAISAALMLMMGFDPLLAYRSMLSGAMGNANSIAETLVKTVPRVFAALSFAIAAKCGVFNLGAPGQMTTGAIVATLVGTHFEGLPPILHIPFVLIAGFIGGGLFGLLAGWLRNRFGASELITTIMLNHIAMQFLIYLVSGPMKDPLVAQTNTPQSKLILESAKLPILLPGTRLHAGLILAILFLILFWVFLNKTAKGYEMRVCGINPNAGEYAGMNVKQNQLLAMALAGGLAGLAGCVELMSVQSRLINHFAANIGFDGVAVSLLGGNSPAGIAVAGLLFGMLSSGANKMQMLAKVPHAMVYSAQGLIILFVVGKELFRGGAKRRKNCKPSANRGGLKA